MLYHPIIPELHHNENWLALSILISHTKGQLSQTWNYIQFDWLTTNTWLEVKSYSWKDVHEQVK